MLKQAQECIRVFKLVCAQFKVFLCTPNDIFPQILVIFCRNFLIFGWNFLIFSRVRRPKSAQNCSKSRISTLKRKINTSRMLEKLFLALTCVHRQPQVELQRQGKFFPQNRLFPGFAEIPDFSHISYLKIAKMMKNYLKTCNKVY